MLIRTQLYNFYYFLLFFARLIKGFLRDILINGTVIFTS